MKQNENEMITVNGNGGGLPNIIGRWTRVGAVRAMSPSTTCTARASYKKLPGILELTSTHLQWTQDGRNAPTVKVQHVDAASLFCSKEGSAQVRLKIGLVNDDAGHNFTFTSPQAVALVEREKFKQELTNIISRNRSAAPTPAPLRPSVTPGTPVPLSNVPTPRLQQLARPSMSRAQSVASDSRRSGTPSDPTGDYRLRKRVLLSNAELAGLHKELVIGGQITEVEFWEGREHLIAAQAASENQRKGKSGQLVDPRPTTVDGETKIVVTPQLVHDIFEEYPIVEKAYNDNVPKKLSEGEFWKRYFQSKLFNAHRASIRSSAAQHVVKDDPIFDKYLEKDDDELEPRRIREIGVDLFIDLGATYVDHVETGNLKDVTMQAGKQKAVLPLIRKFNEHSGRLLNTTLGEPSAKRRKLNSAEDERYAQIDIEDLRDNETSTSILLNMQDRERYFEGRSAEIGPAAPEVDIRAAIREAKVSLHDWQGNLVRLKMEKKAADSAVLAMTQNVAARLDVRMRTNDIPENTFRQMTTCQTAANEFLRQFWLSIYPPPHEAQSSSVTTPAQKAAKATKMIGYLERTHERVEAIVRSAQMEGVDSSRVQVAMKPILDSVDKALAFWKARSSNSNPRGAR